MRNRRPWIKTSACIAICLPLASAVAQYVEQTGRSGTQKLTLAQALSPNSPVARGQWMMLETKSAAGVRTYGFIVRGNPSAGAKWATMALAFTGAKWTAADVCSDRLIAVKDGKAPIQLTVDGVSSTNISNVQEKQTFLLDAAKLAKLLMTSNEVEVQFLPAGEAAPVHARFDVRGFRESVARKAAVASATAKLLSGAEPLFEIHEPKLQGPGQIGFDGSDPLMVVTDLSESKMEDDPKSVNLWLTPKDAKRFAKLTKSHVGRYLLLRASDEVMEVMHITGAIEDGHLRFPYSDEPNVAEYLRHRLKLPNKGKPAADASDQTPSVTVAALQTPATPTEGENQRPAPSPTRTEGGFYDIRASVRFAGTEVVVTNGDKFDWTDVECEINGGFFSSGYILRIERIGAGETAAFGVMRFAKPTGERFNPLNLKPQQLVISCDTKRGRGFWSGKWKD